MVRNSAGNSSGRFCVGSGSFFSSGASCAFFSSGSGAGGLISVGCMFSQVFFTYFGTETENKGFLVRIINVVVAIYNGSAASINMPKTKPGNPRNFACNNKCQCRPENILKLNRNLSTSHTKAV